MKHHHKDFLGFGLFILFLFVAWVVTNGPQHAKQTGDAYNKYQEPLGPIQSGATYNDAAHSGTPFDVIPDQPAP